jgi:ribosomal protein S12 methylthiotransferase
VPVELKQERAAELMEIQQGISYELNQEKVGQTFKVLFDKAENGFFIGRTEFDSPEVDNEVMVSTQNNFVRIGDFAEVKIESAQEFDLFGNVVK